MGKEELEWVLARITDWRARVGNRTKIGRGRLADIVGRIERAGVGRSLTCFVLLGCEWAFRLRETGPVDTENALARIEGHLANVLTRDDAWVVTEALAPMIGKLLRRHRALAPELEDERSRFTFGDQDTGRGMYDRELRTPPRPSILARPGPVPRPAPWIAGVVVERLLEEPATARLRKDRTARPRTLALELTAVLCGRHVDETDYRAARRSLRGAALDKFFGDAKHLHDVIASLDMQPPRQWPRDWFRVVADKLEFNGPQNTFPYYLPTVVELVTAYRTSASGRAAKNSGRSAR